MDGGEIVFREIATADAGLVGDENDAVACVAETLKTCDRAIWKFNSGRIGEVSFVDDNRVIAVDEDVIFIIHNYL